MEAQYAVGNTNFAGSRDVEVKVAPAIQIEVDGLRGIVENLWSIKSALEERLGKVLRPSCVEPSPKNSNQPSQVPLASELATILTDLHGVYSALCDLRERVEV